MDSRNAEEISITDLSRVQRSSTVEEDNKSVAASSKLTIGEVQSPLVRDLDDKIDSDTSKMLKIPPDVSRGRRHSTPNYSSKKPIKLIKAGTQIGSINDKVSWFMTQMIGLFTVIANFIKSQDLLLLTSPRNGG